MKGLIFTYLMTYGGSAVALFRPYTGLLIYVCFAILTPEAVWHWSVPKGNYSRTVAIALLLGWAMKGFGDWRFGQAGIVVAGLIGYLMVWIAGATVATDKELAWMGVEPLAKIVLPFLAGISLIDSVDRLKQLAWVIVLSQGYLALEFNMSYYDGLIMPEEWRFRGMDNNGIAITMVTTIGPAFFLGMEAPRWYMKTAAFGSAALMTHVVLFSMSRGGMLAMGVTGLVSFLLIPKRPKHYLAMLLGGLLILRLAGPSVQEEFLTVFNEEEERDASATTRLDHWAACMQSIIENPFGVGPDHWPRVAPEYGLPAMEAHTTWLQLGAELGLPGLACLGLFYGMCSVRLWPITGEKFPVPDPWLRHLARMVIASLAGFIVAAQFVTSEGVELPYYITLIGAGVLRLLPRSSTAAVGGVDGWSHSVDLATMRGQGSVASGGV